MKFTTVKKSVTAIALQGALHGAIACGLFGLNFVSATVFAQAPQTRVPEFTCTATDVQERLPSKVQFRLTTPMELEAKAFDLLGKESKSTLRRNAAPDQTRAAVFLMGGQLGVSGDARMLIAPSALEFGEIGTIMIVNHSTRESLAYQCSKQ